MIKTLLYFVVILTGLVVSPILTIALVGFFAFLYLIQFIQFYNDPTNAMHALIKPYESLLTQEDPLTTEQENELAEIMRQTDWNVFLKLFGNECLVIKSIAEHRLRRYNDALETFALIDKTTLSKEGFRLEDLNSVEAHLLFDMGHLNKEPGPASALDS